MQTWDIHGRKRRRERIEELLKESDIDSENVKLILRYVDYRTTQSNITDLRQEKLISSLRTFAGFLGKPFKDAKKEDIERILAEVYNMTPEFIRVQERIKQKGLITKVIYKTKTRVFVEDYLDAETGEKKRRAAYKPEENGDRLAESTKNAYAKVLKMFFVWLKEKKNPKETDWIKPPTYKSAKLRTEDKLFWEDVEKLSKAATTKRDYCLPQVLLDSGARIEELLTLRIKDVEFTPLAPEGGGKPELAAKLHIRKSKTEERSPMIYKSVPALRDYIENHPLGRNSPESPLFVNLTWNNNPLSYKEARTILMNLKRRSGLKKRVNPHSFRKASCSLCGDMGLGDSQIDKRFGWAIGSRVKASYLFPEEAKANEAYLTGSGLDLKTKKEKKDEPKPLLCPFCETLNPIGKQFCINPKCRLPLSSDGKQAEEKLRVKELVMEALEEINGKDLNKLDTVMPQG